MARAIKQSQMAATCVGFGGSQVKPRFISRLAAACVGPRAHWGSLGPALPAWEALGNCIVWAKCSHSYGKAAWVGPKVGWGRVSGNLQHRSNSVSQVDRVSDMAPACQLTSSMALWGEGLEKGQRPLLALMPDSLVSPFMPLGPFKLLPWCWSSEGVNLSRWVHVWVL